MATKRILLTEDDFDIAEMLTTFFKVEGYEVMHAPTGKRAIKMAQLWSPTVILLDIMLPDMTGFEVLEQIKQIDTMKDVPVVFLSQKNDRDTRV